MSKLELYVLLVFNTLQNMNFQIQEWGAKYEFKSVHFQNDYNTLIINTIKWIFQILMGH